MKKYLLSGVLTLLTSISFSQVINVSTTTYTVPQLVQDVLFGSGVGGGACAGTISNITWSTGTNFGGPNGIGSFTNTNPNFPLSSGVILTSGSATAAPGPNTSTQSNGTWTGDTQLFNYITALGIDPGLTQYRNATILEFDFVPLTNTMSFDFLFASEEYGTFQCDYSDAFAFFLTNVTAGTPFTNLALIPTTTTPVSVITIRNNLYNGGCASVNPAFFDKYYLLPQGINPNLAPINFNGHTIKMTASSAVVPNNTYHIKLVVADRNDNMLDSAVFLGGGSFNIGQANISGANGTGFEGLTDFTIANGAALCDQSTREVRAGTSAIPGVSYQWTLNTFNIPGATNYNYTITQPGTYGIVITFATGCQQIDNMVVEYLPAIPINAPIDLDTCPSGTFNLSLNTPIVLGTFIPDTINYFTSLANAQNFSNELLGSNLTSFNGIDGQQIWVRVDDNNSCSNIQSFFLNIQTCQATPNPVPNLTLCDDVSNDGIEEFDFSAQTAIALLGNIASNYTISYHLTQADANADANAISSITSFFNTTNPQTIFIRMEEVANSSTFGTTSFQLIVSQNLLPTFNPVAAICSGSPLSPLPTTSNNGVFGVWTPALDNITTTTYTFTPNTGQCATTTTTSITVNPLPNGTATGGTSVLQNSGPTSITFTGLNGIAPYTFTYNINGVLPNQTITTTVGNSVSISIPSTLPGTSAVNLVGVQDSNTPSCFRLLALSSTVIVIPIPSATITGTITVCQNDPSPSIIFTGLNGTAPYIFTYNINGGLNQTTVPSIGNSVTLLVPTNGVGVFNYNLVSVQDANSTQPQVGIATVNVIAAPVITAPTSYQVCDDNNDGLSCLFFLSTKDIEIAAPGLTVTYHETLINSQTGANPIVQNPYCSIDTTGLQTLYVRVFDSASPSCYSNTTLQLVVNPRPLPNPVITDYVFCDTTTPGDGFEVFNLPTKDIEIANGLPLANFTIRYYLTQSDAINQTIPLPNLYQNVTPNFQTIWINISNNATLCNSVASFNLVVNPLPLVVAPPPMFECSNGLIMTAAFDLPLNNGIISGFIPGVAVTYYLTCADAQNEVNPLPIPYTNIANPQTICVRVENIASGCFDTTSLQLNVTQGPLANTPPPLQFCDPNNDGIGVFDLNAATPSIVGGVLPAGVSISYHETQTDAEISANPLVSPYTNITAGSQIVYVRVFYTLTGCANYVQLKLIVNSTPVATDPSDYHECDDNYDGFAVFDLTTVTPQILGSINVATHLVTYHTSLLDAQNALGSISNVLNYTNATINNQTLWVRVETTATGCYDIVELDLIVDPLPLSTQPGYVPYSLCDNTSPLGYEQFDLQSRESLILLGQLGMSVTFYPSLAQAQGQIGAIPSGLYTNISPVVQTLGVVITNTATGCYVISTMDIRVEPLPTPIAPLQPYTVCDTDQDGFSGFDLCTLTASINAGYIISYHETQLDAEQNNLPLSCIYQNIQSFIQIIWVRAQDPLTLCVSTMPIILQVDPSPILPTLPNLVSCDQDSNNQNGITSFDFSPQTATLLSAQTSAAANYAVSYYNTQLDAEAPNNNIVSTTNYPGFDTEVIWVRIEHTTTGCYTLGSFTLEVNTPLALTAPSPLNVCDNDANPNDLHTSFDLTVKDNEITGSLPGYSVTYYPTWPVTPTSVAITPATAYINVPPAVQTLGVEVTSPDGCKSYTTLNIRVLPVPTPRNNPPVLAAQCENALDSGVQTMDITVNAAYIINGDPNVTLHYFHTLADATSIPPVNEILTPTAALIGDPTLLNVNPRPIGLIQNVYVVVSSNLFIDFNTQNCYTVVEQPFIINPLPIVVAIGAQQMCEADPTGNDGFEVFDLTGYTPLLLAGNATIPVSNYTVAFYSDAALTNLIANPTAYTNTTNPQTIYAQVTNTSTGCSNSAPFDIIVNPKPSITPPATFATCDNELNDNDGYYLYALDALIPGILNGQLPGNFTVSFYNSQADAQGTPPTNAIANLGTYQAQTQTIWIRVENNTTGCYQVDSFDIIIEQYATPVIETDNNSNTICVNFITNVVERDLTLFASNTTVYLIDPQPSYDYQWYVDGVAIPGAVSPGYTINTPLANNTSAVYTVSMTTTGALGCSTTSQGFTVLQSGPAVVAVGTIGYTITDAFSENQILTVIVEGWGTYQYSLNDGPRQDSPVFEHVPLGTNTITVWDTEGGLDYSCDALVIEELQVINYPHYFTPNGDGYHDTWNIVGLEDQPSTKIYIFDRFGKLIKQISSTGQGWDGRYNGVLMPSTDYWFTVDYTEQDELKQFKAHFSLKR